MKFVVFRLNTQGVINHSQSQNSDSVTSLYTDTSGVTAFSIIISCCKLRQGQKSERLSCNRCNRSQIWCI